MPDILLTPRQNGRISLSATSVSAAASDVITNATLVAACQQGPLRQLLAATYADLTAFLTAAAAAGLNKSVSAGAGTSAVWSLSGGGLPQLSVAASGAGQPIAVRISLAHSSVR